MAHQHDTPVPIPMSSSNVRIIKVTRDGVFRPVAPFRSLNYFRATIRKKRIPISSSFYLSHGSLETVRFPRLSGTTRPRPERRSRRWHRWNSVPEESEEERKLGRRDAFPRIEHGQIYRLFHCAVIPAECWNRSRTIGKFQSVFPRDCDRGTSRL